MPPSRPELRPNPAFLDWITATGFEELRRCPRSMAYRRDPRFASLSLPSEWSMLGSAAHAVLEASLSGRLATEAQAVVCWDRAVAAQWAGLEGRRLLAPAPQPTRSRGYTLARRRALRMVVLRAGDGHSPRGVRREAEIDLADERLRIRGRADLVEVDRGITRIVDFKSALRGHDGLSPAHRSQLLLYAYLWHVLKGDWPDTCAIEYLDGTSDAVAVVASEASEVANAAASLRKQFNGTVADRGEHRACTAPGACRFCDFQCVCLGYLEVASGPDWGSSVAGTVVRVTRTGGSTQTALAAERGSLRGDGEFTVHGLPAWFEPLEGSDVAFSRLRTRSGRSAAADWQTRVWPQHPPGPTALEGSTQA
jgi:hypothetical protein